ncbi:MAG TPA: DNA polymerase III subunit delta', partial [Phycisphaerales bacterium]|nr:DNA polymerase III subunit delta' [Phycisphaerales bacterium]
AYRTPSLAPAKVFIIDEAERLDLPGQNALLKTLEEPPPSTYLFLVTSRPERLLPTIWSR